MESGLLKPRSATDERFDEALALVDRGDYETALALLLECVIATPDNAEYLEEFLANLAKKFPPPQSPVVAIANSATSLPKPPLFRNGPAALLNNPWHLPTLTMLAEAHREAQHSEVAYCYTKLALSLQPNDRALVALAAELLTQLGRADDARTAWRRLLELEPENTVAPRKIAELVIDRSRRKTGWNKSIVAPAPQPRPARQRRTATPAPSLPRRSLTSLADDGAMNEVDLKRTPIQQLEFAIRERPGIPDYYLRLVPLYLEIDRDHDAERLLTKGRESTSEDPAIVKMWEEVVMLRMNRKIAATEKKLQEEPSEETQNALAELLKDRDHLELEIFRNRCKLDPKNTVLQLHLAQRLKRAGKTTEAVQWLNKALAAEECRCAAAFELADCCVKQGEIPDALRLYRQCADALLRPEDQPLRLEAYYQSGLLAQQLQLTQLAQRYFAEATKIDASYKDAAARLRDLQWQ